MKLTKLYRLLAERGLSDLNVEHITLSCNWSDMKNIQDKMNEEIANDGTHQSDIQVEFSTYNPIFRDDLVAELVMKGEDPSIFKQMSDDEVRRFYVDSLQP